MDLFCQFLAIETMIIYAILLAVAIKFAHIGLKEGYKFLSQVEIKDYIKLINKKEDYDEGTKKHNIHRKRFRL